MRHACVDTNIWFYELARPNSGDALKHQVAQKLIKGLTKPLLTPQIANELSFNLIRKQAWAETVLRDLIKDLLSHCRFEMPVQDWHSLASHVRERYQISFWDSLIVASAQAANCDVLFTEDLQHGFRIGSLELINPFSSIYSSGP